MSITRRELIAGALCVPAAIARARELSCDVAVIGGSFGGCAAALAAARNGMRVVMTEECAWIGGQVTSQAVPPDEHPWIEQFGCTRAYRAFRNGVREYYRRNYPLTEAARSRWNLNPGDGGVSRLTHEPRVALAVLEEMLALYVSAGRMTILTGHRPVAADVDKDRIRAVTVEGRDGHKCEIQAPYFLDATEQGDLLPLTKAEYTIGSESLVGTGEPHGSQGTRPENIQSFTFCFAVDYLPGEDHTIDKPEEYPFWRDYVPQLRPPWPGKLLSWSTSHPVTLQERKLQFDPTLAPRGAGELNLWLYRRIANRQNFAPGAYPSDITLVNWPQNDFWLGAICDVSAVVAAGNLRLARQLSLSLLYWMQMEQGWKGLRLRPDIVGTEDGLAQYPYIRESRRIQAEFTVREQQLGEDFADSVGIGSYRIDLHPSTGGDNYIDVDGKPFQIPLGALIPKRMENLLPACKNLGVTHVTNGCYRLHPVEWNIGESSGMLAAHGLATKKTPRQIRNSAKLLQEFQAKIQAQGVEIAWPRIGLR